MKKSNEGAWAQAGGGPGRTGRMNGTLDLEAQPAQTVQVGAGLQASVVFDGEDRALVADMDGVVHALDHAHLLWRRALEGPVSATPAVDVAGARLFVGTHSGWVFCLQCADGAVLWKKRLPSDSDPRIVADLLFLENSDRVWVSSWGGRFHVLDASAGSDLQSWEAGIAPQSAASADSKFNVYFLRAVRDEGISLVRIGADRVQTVLHQSRMSEGVNRAIIAAAPVIDDERGLLYFVTNGVREGRLHAWDLNEERVAWTQEFARTVVATPALRSDGAVMVADMSGVLSAVREGAVEFRYNTSCEYLLSGPVCDGAGRVYLGDPVGWLHRVDATGQGQPLFDARRSLQARPSWDSAGALHLPVTNGRVHRFASMGITKPDGG